MKRLLFAAVLALGVGAFAQETIKMSSAKIAYDRQDEASLKEARGFIDEAGAIIDSKAGAVIEKTMSKYLEYRGLIYLASFEKTKDVAFLKEAQVTLIKLLDYEKANKLRATNRMKAEVLPGLAGALVAAAEDAVFTAKDTVAGLGFYESAVQTRSALGIVDTLNISYLAALNQGVGNYEKAETYFKQVLDLGFKNISWTGFYTKNNARVQFPDKKTLDFFIATGEAKDPERSKSQEEMYWVQTVAMYLEAKSNKPGQGWDVKMEEFLKKARLRYPNNGDLLNVELQIFLDKKDYEGAMANMLKASEREPNNPLYLYNIGYLYHKEKKDVAKGIEFYEKALAADPNYGDALYMRGLIFVDESNVLVESMNKLTRSAADQKKWEELDKKKKSLLSSAIPYFEKAYKANPQDLATLDALREVYYKTERMEDALRIKREADALRAKR
jgi:tetratricopeptide (TPR) repeat protein